jgi:hypothetical protein
LSGTARGILLVTVARRTGSRRRLVQELALAARIVLSATTALSNRPPRRSQGIVVDEPQALIVVTASVLAFSVVLVVAIVLERVLRPLVVVGS